MLFKWLLVSGINKLFKIRFISLFLVSTCDYSWSSYKTLLLNYSSYEYIWKYAYKTYGWHIDLKIYSINLVSQTWKAEWAKSQDISNTRKHMQTPRLNIVLQRINVEDRARICAPNFKIFFQSTEIIRQTNDKGSKSMKGMSFNNLQSISFI